MHEGNHTRMPIWLTITLSIHLLNIHACLCGKRYPSNNTEKLHGWKEAAERKKRANVYKTEKHCNNLLVLKKAAINIHDCIPVAKLFTFFGETSLSHGELPGQPRV